MQACNIFIQGRDFPTLYFFACVLFARKRARAVPILSMNKIKE